MFNLTESHESCVHRYILLTKNPLSQIFLSPLSWAVSIPLLFILHGKMICASNSRSVSSWIPLLFFVFLTQYHNCPRYRIAFDRKSMRVLRGYVPTLQRERAMQKTLMMPVHNFINVKLFGKWRISVSYSIDMTSATVSVLCTASLQINYTINFKNNHAFILSLLSSEWFYLYSNRVSCGIYFNCSKDNIRVWVKTIFIF